MEVILLDNLKGLGKIGKVVRVANGFARNYLVPQGKAVLASLENRASFDAKRAEFEANAAAKQKAAEERAEAVRAIGPITLTARAADEGKLYGSIGTYDIAKAMTEAGAPMTRDEIRLPKGALREIGTFEVQVHFHSEVEFDITVNIVPEE